MRKNEVKHIQSKKSVTERAEKIDEFNCLVMVN